MYEEEKMSLCYEMEKLVKSREGAYNVGALIVDYNGIILSYGYSRKYGENEHAEEIALRELKYNGDCILYTSMETCSRRTSGKKSCVERIKEDGRIRKVFFGRYEPKDIVPDCCGYESLREFVDIKCVRS